MNNEKHTWNFSMVGGVNRVHLVSGKDLVHLHALDQKLWTALSCPVEGLEIDPKTLSLIDSNQDGQIRVPEILEAVHWITSVLHDPEVLLNPETEFPLKAINTQTELGAMLLASAQTMLTNLGKPNASHLSLADTQDTDTFFSAAKFNGDGVITTDCTDNPELIEAILIIQEIVGTVKDRGGKSGINSDLLNQFIAACEAYLAWKKESTEQASTILPFGESTPAAFDSLSAVAAKIDDYFLRCKLAAFNQSSTPVLNLVSERVEQITEKNLLECLPEIAAYPIAEITPTGILPLETGINPAWETQMQLFNQQVITPYFKTINTLQIEQWNQLKLLMQPYQNWLTNKQGEQVEHLGIEVVTKLTHHTAALQLLIEEDLKLSEEADNIVKVDKLVRYYLHIFTLLNNFVTFYDFYTPGKKAIFQAGTLYIDQRSCNLCIKVNDLDKHKTMAGFSGMFLMYCECTNKTTGAKMTIAAALTNGDIDDLVEGRNAIFYDRLGNDWDATVVKIIDNPISIRQAFWSPYRKVSRFIEKQVNKVASDQDSKVTSDATSKIEEFPTKAVTENKPPAQPFDVGKFVGIFAAISLALGAIGTAIASFITGFIALTWWKMPLAIAGILLLISGPSMVMAYLKLRKRNLAPLLDANGWAVNAGAVINIQFGNVLTHLADLPTGAKVNLNDPFTKKQRPILAYIIGLLLLVGLVFYLLWKNGLVHIR